MKPVAQIEKRAGYDSEARAIVDIHRAAVVPTHEGGHFIIQHSFYGKVAVDRIVLLDAAEEDITELHTTGEFPLDTYVTTDEHGVSTVARAGVNVPFDGGSGNSVFLSSVTTFQEFMPVTADVAATV